jgi:hypothetical protein
LPKEQFSSYFGIAMGDKNGEAFDGFTYFIPLPITALVYIAIDHKTWKAFALKIMVRLRKVSHGV